MPSLCGLNISFAECPEITASPIEVFCSALEHLKKLQKLHLNFSRCRLLNGLIFHNLAEALNKMKSSLRSLDINVSECELIGDSSLRALASGLESLSNLTDLKLNLEALPVISSQGFQDLSLGFKGLKSLKKITLVLCHESIQKRIENINDEVCLALFEALRGVSLEYVDFRVADDFISDKCVIGVFNVLKEFSKLSELYLSFCKSENITDKAFQSASSDLRLMSSLRNLKMNFRWCGNITSKSIKNLAESVKSLQSLRSIFWDFYGSPFITNDDENELKNVLKQMKTLKFTELYFGYHDY